LIFSSRAVLSSCVFSESFVVIPARYTRIPRAREDKPVQTRNK
jgi:hypothetical protein